MGIVDYFRIPKRSWYWYRNEYNHIAPPEWAKPGIPAKLKLEADKTMGIRIDGTDDVQLTVTVLDAQGKEISNSPEVTLKLVAGPGEFPTGTSITFKQDSDIRIQDGKAAIAFRSYYAGKTLIEASSPGLVPARVELVFEGDPQYVPNVTPQVRERPYVRYTSANRERPLQTFGRNNPTLPAVSLKVMWLHWLLMEMWLLGGRLRKEMLRLIGYLIRKRDWICNKLLWFFRKQLFIDSGWRCLMTGKNGE